MDQNHTIPGDDDPTFREPSYAPSPRLDLEKYRALAGDIEAPSESVDALLATLWEIMAAFVHHGFDAKTIPAFLPEFFADSSNTGGVAVDSIMEDTDDQT